MALANAAAAAEVAEAQQLEVVADANDGCEQLEVMLTRAADGTLGIVVADDDEGKPAVVTSSAASVRVGDIVLSIDGSNIHNAKQFQQELRYIFATGVAEEMQDEVRIVLLRPPQIVQPTEWTVADVPLAAGETKDVALPSVNEPALGTFSFASAPVPPARSRGWPATSSA